MEFQKYMHIEKYGNAEVEEIEYGMCYIFPKIDGTNSSVWIDENNKLQAGSRRRHLTLEEDNAGFYAWVLEQDNIKKLLSDYPSLRLYGEWLVPHALKTYREDAWRKFYVFDVSICDNDTFMNYEDYKSLLDKYEIEYIPPICKIENPTYEKLLSILDKNDYLIKDGCGVGEGIVIKNYNFKNKFGRTIWAKIVTTDFRVKHRKVSENVLEMKEKQMVEKLIADKYIVTHLIDKTKAKIENEHEGWSCKNIPQLLNTVFYDLIKEESWSFLKEHKFPTVNYGTLRHFTIAKIKELRPEIF